MSRPPTNREFLAHLLNRPEQVNRIYRDIRGFFPPFPEHGICPFIWYTLRITGFPFPGYPLPYFTNPTQLGRFLLWQGFSAVPPDKPPVIGDLYLCADEESRVTEMGFVVGEGGFDRGYVLTATHSLPEGKTVRRIIRTEGVGLPDITCWLHA